MNKFKRSIFILLLAFFASNCTEEPIEHNRPPSVSNYVPLSVEEARDYFESHAECLEGLYFREKPSTKSTDWKLQLSPRWEDAAVRTLDSSSMVELPLSSNAWLIAKRNIVKGKSRASDVTTGFRKLVIRERKNGSMQQFVITVIPTGKKSGWFVAHPEKFNFFGGEGFNGYVFCSTLEGKFTGVYEYVDGVRYRRHLELNVEIPVQTKGAAEEYPEEGEYATISMFNAPMEDSDNIPESPDGEKPGGCNHHDVYDPNCPYCLDDVPVIGSKCHECGKAVCVCCSFCGRYPCQCPPPDPGAFPEPVPCWNCGDIHCDGECYIHGGPSQDDDKEEEKCPECGNNPCTCCAICHKDPCECPKINISLNKNTVDLGTKIQVNVSIGNTTANCNYISYSLTKDGRVTSKSFTYSQLSYETIVRDVGEFEVSVEAGFDGLDRWYESENTVKFTCQFPSIYTIKEIPAVKAGMEDAWAKTLADADENGCREYGGVIMLNTTTDKENDYSFVLKTGEWCGYEEEEYSVTLDYQENHYGFENGGNFCVMLFHAHPPLWNCPLPNKKRPLGPSKADMDNHGHFPAIVWDFDNQYLTELTPAVPKEQCIRKEYIYGVERRKN